MDKWGPGLWYTIHSYALEMGHKPSDYWLFLNQLVAVIPCMKCRKSAATYLHKNPIQIHDLDLTDHTGRFIGIFIWTVDFHNWVNKELGKEHMSWQRALNYYSMLSEGESGCDECHT